MQKYKLPATHSLFLEQTYAELFQEQLEDLYLEMAELEDQVARGQDRAQAQMRLSRVKTALGEGGDADALIDSWEADIAAGRIPDLDKLPEG